MATSPYTLTHFPWQGPGMGPQGFYTQNTVPPPAPAAAPAAPGAAPSPAQAPMPNPYLQGMGGGMAYATPGPDGQYGMGGGGMQGVPQWGTPPPGAMAGPGRGAGGVGAQMGPPGGAPGTPLSGGYDINQVARGSQAAGPMYGDPNSAAMGGAFNPTASGIPSRSKRIARLEVVPWSSARTDMASPGVTAGAEG